ncbi:MAG TPA: hypothetical protein VLW44_21535 [Streptosporangiaceae bacterium]|nr:hypothetical protein [Streptosporangiaceae bacterium]
MVPQPPRAGDRAAVPAGEPEIRSLVERYVRELATAGAIRSARTERAFRTVERHRLLETFSYRAAGSPDAVAVHHDPGRPLREHLELIYSDQALVTRSVNRMPASSASQPSLVAGRLELLDLADGMKVLEIGAGTGYNAVHDRRACHAPQGPGLSDGRGGWAVAGPDGIWWWKDPSLARELDRLYRAWDGGGRPAIGDYQVSFRPVQADFSLPPGGWQIERRFFRELLSWRA